MATLSHIANRCGVSRRTVASILTGGSDPQRPSAIKRAARVRAVAEELGYRPNAAAKAVATKRFNNITLLLAEHIFHATLPIQLLRGIEQAAGEAEQRLSLARLPNTIVADETKLPAVLREHSTDGLLINYHFHSPPAMQNVLERSGIPAIWLNAKRDHDAVYPDEHGAGIMAAEYLLKRGFRRIAYVDYSHGQAELSEKHYSATDREAGYREAMRHAGLQPRVVRDPRRTLERDQRYAAASQLLNAEDRPEAVITYADSTAIPIAIAGFKRGLPVGTPKLPIVTFADAPIDFLGSPLPTLLVPHLDVGRRGVLALLRRIAGDEAPLSPDRVPFDLTDQPIMPPRES